LGFFRPFRERILPPADLVPTLLEPHSAAISCVLRLLITEKLTNKIKKDKVSFFWQTHSSALQHEANWKVAQDFLDWYARSVRNCMFVVNYFIQPFRKFNVGIFSIRSHSVVRGELHRS